MTIVEHLRQMSKAALPLPVRSPWALAAVLLVLAGLGAPPASASKRGTHYRIGALPGLAEEWRNELDAADRALQAGRFQEARRSAEIAVRSMFQVVRGGQDAGPLLGLAVLFRALAEAGLGEKQAALWDWHLVVALHPPLVHSDLGAYGELGEIFTQGTSDALGSQPDKAENLVEGDPGALSSPRRIRGKRPTYPPALSATCHESTLAIGVVLTEGGVPISPRSLSPDADPIFLYSAFEALRKWRFKPARLDGKPVRVLHNLSVNFKSPGCRRITSPPGYRGVPGPPSGP